MEKFYTAVGPTQIRTNQRGNQNPVVICNEKEYILDLPEIQIGIIEHFKGVA